MRSVWQKPYWRSCLLSGNIMGTLETLYHYFARPSFFTDVMKVVMRRTGWGNYLSRVRIHAVERPEYAFCVLQSAQLASRLGFAEMSVIEFGVAAGQGLLALERHSKEIGNSLGIKIHVYGFDTGTGLPEPVDYKDLPYHWQHGFYAMNEEKLRQRLQDAELILGNVGKTITSFCNRTDIAPIGAVMFDLDFYSSTVEAFKIFNIDQKKILPRVYCYFDDIIGGEGELYCQFTGERLAIREFNDANTKKKIADLYYLRSRKVTEYWYEAIRVMHYFEHQRYNQFVGTNTHPFSLSS